MNIYTKIFVTYILTLSSVGAIYASTSKVQQPEYYKSADKAGGTLYVSGQNAQNNNEKITGDIQEQTKAAINMIGQTLKNNGYTFNDVVDVNVAIAKQSEFSGFNETYATYFKNRPARSVALGVLHQNIGALVEISVIAYKKP